MIDNGNLRSFFRYVNCRTSFKSVVVPLKNETGVIQYDDLNKARLLNINFSSNFTADNNILPSNGVLNKDYVNKLNSVCFTPENDKKIINKLKSNGCPDPDKFSGLLFKML